MVKFFTLFLMSAVVSFCGGADSVSDYDESPHQFLSLPDTEDKNIWQGTIDVAEEVVDNISERAELADSRLPNAENAIEEGKNKIIWQGTITVAEKVVDDLVARAKLANALQEDEINFYLRLIADTEEAIRVVEGYIYQLEVNTPVAIFEPALDIIPFYGGRYERSRTLILRQFHADGAIVTEELVEFGELRNGVNPEQYRADRETAIADLRELSVALKNIVRVVEGRLAKFELAKPYAEIYPVY